MALEKQLIDSLSTYSRILDKASLKTLACLLGAGSSGTKPEMAASLIKQAQRLHRLQHIRESKGSISLTSIDMGIVNFAYSRLEWKKSAPFPTVVEWHKLKLVGFLRSLSPSDKKEGKIPSDPAAMTILTSALSKFLTVSTPDVFLIERQRARTLGCSAISESILRVNILEYLLFSNLSRRTQPCPLLQDGGDYRCIVESSSPRRMVEYWCSFIPESDNSHSSATKRIRIALVRSLLANAVAGKTSQDVRKFLLSKELEMLFKKQKGKYDGLDLSKVLAPPSSWSHQEIEYTTSSSSERSKEKQKNDDLCDSLLHGLAWVDWIKNYEALKSFMLDRKPGELNEASVSLKTLIHSLNEQRRRFAQKCINVKI